MIRETDLEAYVVNLTRRPDRRQRMESIIPKPLHATFTSDWRGLFDGKQIDQLSLKRHGYELFPWEIESDNSWWSRPLKLGEIGCTISHLECWQRGLNSGKKYVLVLEDDVRLAPDFVHQLLNGLNSLNDHEPVDLIYLGRFPLEPDLPGPTGFLIPGYSHCTFGYMLRTSTIPRLLDAELANALIPIDEFLPAMYIDHPRRDVRTRFPARLNALAFEPPIVWQLPKDEAGSDTEDSEFVDW